MITAIADTHTIIWYLAKDPRLSSVAKAFIDDTAHQGQQIGVSSISLIEMVYLIEKDKIPAIAFTLLTTSLEKLDSELVEVPVSLAVARTLSGVSALKIPDMPDRIVSATALHLGVPIISRDGKIQLSGLATIW